MYFLNFLVSTTCFFLLLFSAHLFFSNKGNKANNILLSVLFLTRACQILTSIIIKSGNQKVLAIFFQSLTPIYFIAPACLYLYVTGFLNNRKGIKKWEWLHFIPFLIAAIHVFPWPGQPKLDWHIIASQLGENGYHTLNTKSGLFPNYFHSWGRTILILIYLPLCWLAVNKSGIRKQTDTNNPGKDWIFFLLSAATLFQVIGLLPIAIKALHIPLYHTSFIAINCIVLLGILLYALHKANMFYGYLLVAADWTKIASFQLVTEGQVIDLPKVFREKGVNSAQKKNNLSEQQLSSYSIMIKDAMENDQLYLKADLQIIDLATKLNIPIHHCSYVLNNEIGKNFRDWINGYRVQHFLKQYPIVSGRITIEAIAQESGFKSLATFYNAFKKEKGVLPTDYFQKSTS